MSTPLTPQEKTASDAISAWTRAQLRGDYGNYKFTGRPIRGITRTLFDPVFYEILEGRLVREDRARRLQLRMVGRKEWYDHSSAERRDRRDGRNAEEFERPWFEAFGQLAAAILGVAVKNDNDKRVVLEANFRCNLCDRTKDISSHVRGMRVDDAKPICDKLASDHYEECRKRRSSESATPPVNAMHAVHTR